MNRPVIPVDISLGPGRVKEIRGHIYDCRVMSGR